MPKEEKQKMGKHLRVRFINFLTAPATNQRKITACVFQILQLPASTMQSGNRILSYIWSTSLAETTTQSCCANPAQRIKSISWESCEHKILHWGIKLSVSELMTAHTHKKCGVSVQGPKAAELSFRAAGRLWKKKCKVEAELAMEHVWAKDLCISGRIWR